MEFLVLGSLEVVADGRSLPLGGAKQRALLAVLVLNANRVVSSDLLIDALWGERAPDGASHTLHVYVSQLRKTLRVPGSPAPETILTQGRGYVLRVEPGAIDLHRFERMAEEGRRALAAGDPIRAVERLSEALGLWRGPALVDLAFEAFAQPEIARIEDLRLSAIEDRIEADLAFGRHDELVHELQALVAEHPLRERLRAHLMLALYRSGRQAEALGVYRDTRQLLAEELGIDPSPELQRLERAILEQDPQLEVARPRAPLAGRAAPPRRTRGRLTGVAVIVVVLVGAAAVVVATNPGSPPPVSSVEANSVRRVDPASGDVVAAIPTAGTAPTAVEWFDGSVWVANTVSKTVARIDPSTDTVVQTIPTDKAPTDLATAEGVLWVLDGLDGVLLAIDPRTNEVSTEIAVPAGSGGVAATPGAVWVTNRLDATVTRIDPQTREIDGTISLGVDGDASPNAIAASGEDLWVGDEFDALLWRIDATTGRIVASLGLRGIPTAIAAGGGAVWVASRSADLVTRLDPETGSLSTLEVGDAPAGIAVSNGSVWVTSSADGTVRRIDAATIRLVDTIAVGGLPEGVVVGAGHVWVTVPA